MENTNIDDILSEAENIRNQKKLKIHEIITSEIYSEAEKITNKVISIGNKSNFNFTSKLDYYLTNRWTGFPIMFAILAVVFWLTIAGANVPSAMLATLLVDTLHPILGDFMLSIGSPWWLKGFLIDGVYLALAWVVSVMLPPMAIFFPIFTILEDFGYLPRVAFNLDPLFRKSGAHGKQALSMAMGYGCNAAGIIATRIIDSPRERLIAIITNNFSLCNGRWPTQILIATIFIGSLAPTGFAGLYAAGAVVGVTLFGVVLTFLVSYSLSKTVLKGESSSFSLELPPYRPPRILKTLYTSLIDRTLFVLWRALLFAAPSGALIWLTSNITVNDISLAVYTIDFLDPFAIFLGLNGVILLAYIIAIPANEIIIPTVLMLTVLKAGMNSVGAGTGVMFEFDDLDAYRQVFEAGGWTLLTGINLMLFSLLHNPCSTTIYTIYKETKSKRWTIVATLLPIFLGFFVCFVVAQIWNLF